jgi:hypothetical protein
MSTVDRGEVPEAREADREDVFFEDDLASQPHQSHVVPEAGVLVRKLCQLSGLTSGISSCSVESAVS